MTKKIIQTLILIFVLLTCNIAFSAEYTYYTDNLTSLGHSYAYAWEINLSNDNAENKAFDLNDSITSFSLVFSDISDNYSGDILYVNVLDSDEARIEYNVIINDSGILTYTNEGYTTGNYFDTYTYDEGYTEGSLLFTIEDVDSTSNQVSVTYYDLEEPIYEVEGDDTMPITQISSNVIGDLTAYIADGILTIGFDSDCHYFNSGITLKLETDSPGGTSAVPEPETLLLFGLGLIGVSAFGRKRMNIGEKIA
ncbi:PEP-CTERM sorting domain-containing protein [Desulfospira joergensenii]|uniref:PEP-CTERM sorting domain-containing protein n=1 Tax=Desulfospira joergensenii TaxID=53329 RepID=UPI0003B2EAE4|nr:PEP-CTERM sorting domain-containing protein [Desulfospira joergensenii]